MLRTLKDLFDTLTTPAQANAASGTQTTHRLQLATAVLLVEVMQADASIGPAEQASVLATLRRCFKLENDECQRLLDLARDTQRAASDFHAFTSALNAQLSHEEKVQMLQAMWAVAYADGELAAHEQHVLWRVADLLHVPHGAYINAKIRAKGAAGV